MELSDDDLNRVRHKFGMVYRHAARLDLVNVMDNVSFTSFRASLHRATPANGESGRLSARLDAGWSPAEGAS
ncbi:MAG: hypothetical protein ABI193_15355, partial [Minicystis sp.]